MPDVVWTKAGTWVENEPRCNLVFPTQSVLMGKRAGGFYLPLLFLHCLMIKNYNCEGEIFDSKLRVSGWQHRWQVGPYIAYDCRAWKEDGLWAGKESKEHELKGFARGIGWCHSWITLCDFQQGTVLHILISTWLRSGFSLSLDLIGKVSLKWIFENVIYFVFPWGDTNQFPVFKHHQKLRLKPQRLILLPSLVEIGCWIWLKLWIWIRNFIGKIA